uniref:Uncharacterized protein n=1 Tax=Rhipicephalus appendiculatus TaxID=34631 RepID=A0A131YX80_RHIAP
MESGVLSNTHSLVAIRRNESEGPTKDSVSQWPSQKSVAFANAAKSRLSLGENVVSPKEVGPSGSHASTTKTVRESPSFAETSNAWTPVVRPALLPKQVCKQFFHTCIIRAQRGTSKGRAIVAKGEHTYAKCDDELFKCTADAIERKILVTRKKAEIYYKDAQRMRAEVKRNKKLLAQLNDMRHSVNLPSVGVGILKTKRVSSLTAS